MRWAIKIWFVTLIIAYPITVGAWGLAGHRLINYKASRYLKGSFGQFLKNNSEALKWYGAAPDYNKDIDPNEFHRHFIDTDYYDEYPFSKIPKEYEDLVEQYGEENIRKYGMAPWTIKKTCDRIIDLLKKNRLDAAIYNLGILGHYIADLHMPLHTIINYNGQLTGNDGIHKRWEHRLVDEYIKDIKPVGKIEVVEDSWSFSMKIVRESFQLHQLILDADTKARKLLTKEQAEMLNSYDSLPFEKPYLEVLYDETGDLLKDRMGRSVIRLASIWQYCWDQAGRPSLR